MTGEDVLEMGEGITLADLSFVAGEVKDPRRVLPRALIIGVLAVIVIYLLANVAYLAIFPVEELRQSPRIAADVAMRIIGVAGVAGVDPTEPPRSAGYAEPPATLAPISARLAGAARRSVTSTNSRPPATRMGAGPECRGLPGPARSD